MKIGLIVNPIAGMGGAVGLKGTDGPEILKQALELGAVPKADWRTRLAIKRLRPHHRNFDLLTCPGTMGGLLAEQNGLSRRLFDTATRAQTKPEDTIQAAQWMVDQEADLILFAGGDGTARDVCRAVGLSTPTLGIPAGVKIHSAVFASSPAAAGEIAASFIQGRVRRFVEAEVLDIDEEDYRREVLSTRLFGTMMIPDDRRLMQGLKAGSAPSDRVAQKSIAADVVENMDEDSCHLIGPGTTCRPVMERLGLDNSLLGIDLVQAGRQLGKDLSEHEILMMIEGRKVKLVLTPIGGQGFLLGRGNQQISHRVINRLHREDIIVLATDAKLCSLHGDPLLVDSGDSDTDHRLSGHHRIVTGYRKGSIYPVRAASEL
ncbi:MAG: ATP-NAD kinase family protein [bacterium]|nr:ATP-NAD kinase family protein [bacterium]